MGCAANATNTKNCLADHTKDCGTLVPQLAIHTTIITCCYYHNHHRFPPHQQSFQQGDARSALFSCLLRWSPSHP